MDNILFYVPNKMENQTIQNCHGSLGHIGVDKTVEYLLRSYLFPQLKEKVKLYIANCIKCLTYPPASGKKEGILYNIPKGDKHF